MGFIDSYKRLEKLCGEVLNDDRRVSAYIDEMINNPRGSHLISNWDNDLKQLKHYRWVRNKIAHEPDCSEDNMCKPKDAQWIDDFYLRIMNQRDPLALYYQAIKPRKTSRSKPKSHDYTYSRKAGNHNAASNDTLAFIGFLIFNMILIAAIILILVNIM